MFGSSSITRAIIAAVLGSIIYRLAIALALGVKIGGFAFNPSDLNLITALLVITALITPSIKKRVFSR